VKIGQTRAVVTGGASGLGEGVARMIADEGGWVAIFDLPSSRGAELAEELGERAAFFPVDVTSPSEVERAVAGAADFLGRISLLVSSAGISPAARVVDRNGSPFPLERYRLAIEVNLIGAFDVLRQVAARMHGNEPDDEGERGVIVNIGSTAAYEGQVGQAAYSAAKGGIVAMTLPLARDLGPSGIRVMTICPGTIDTPMVQAAPEAVRTSLSGLNLFPARFGRPSEIARVVAACVEVTYLNGEVIRVDAGARMPPR